MRTTTEFCLTYDGPALDTHEVHPRDLSPALLAMAELLESATRVLYGEEAKAKVQVKGSFRTGSFHFDFVTCVQRLNGFRRLFAGQKARGAATGIAVLTALGVIGHGLFGLVKWLRGRLPTLLVPLAPARDGSQWVRVYVDDEFYDVGKKTVDLLRDAVVRAAVEQVLKPLQRPGLDTLALGDGNGFNIIIRDDECLGFVSPHSGDTLLIDEVRTMSFAVVSTARLPKADWVLSDGSATIHASMSDAAFVGSLDDTMLGRLRGDSLVCRMHVRQWQTVMGIRTEYNVVLVMRHIPVRNACEMS
ncbi:hypothetical protein KPL74_10395 [Bacillus sp. NP157]|nr:hypothetical protein KPL74_10395 [Bacillus sp. NP157]